MHTLLLIVLQLGASGADAYYTNRSMEMPVHHERDPIARQFIDSRSGRIAYFSATAGLQIALPLTLKHKHHNKLASLAAISGIADNATGAFYSATHQ